MVTTALMMLSLSTLLSLTIANSIRIPRSIGNDATITKFEKIPKTRNGFTFHRFDVSMTHNGNTKGFFCYISKRSNCLQELEWIEERYKRRYVPEEILNDHVKEYIKSPADYHNEILQEEYQIDVNQVKHSRNFEFMDIPQNLPRHLYGYFRHLQFGNGLKFNCFDIGRAKKMEKYLKKYKF